ALHARCGEAAEVEPPAIADVPEDDAPEVGTERRLLRPPGRSDGGPRARTHRPSGLAFMRRDDPPGNRQRRPRLTIHLIGPMHENGKKRVGAALDRVPTSERNGMTAKKAAVAAIRG